MGIAGCLGCVCDKEVGEVSSSRNWFVAKWKPWGRHNANYYRGNLLQFSAVSERALLLMLFAVCFDLKYIVPSVSEVK